MKTMLTVADLPVTGAKVLVRTDFNVPLDKSAKVTDDTRIRAALPTLRSIIERGGSAIVMSHLGRPKGQVDSMLSLRPVAERLSVLLEEDVLMAPDCVGRDVERLAAELMPGKVMLLENLRFHKGETKPAADPAFVENLARLGDCYVNDAFGSCHRSHGSIVALARMFPEKAAVGMLLEKEICFLGKVVANPKQPFHAIVGGAKVSSKIGVLKALVEKVDTLMIGGAMANTFLKVQGVAVGQSLVEEECLETARKVIAACEKNGVLLLLPTDLICAEKFASGVEIVTVGVKEGVPDKLMALDVGPATLKRFSDALQGAKTVLWNGPMGAFEIAPFNAGTDALAHTVAALDATTIIGGGDSVAAINNAGVADKVTHLSTGGGAALEFLETGNLPGIEVLYR